MQKCFLNVLILTLYRNYNNNHNIIITSSSISIIVSISIFGIIRTLLTMLLLKEENIELILMPGSGCCRKVAIDCIRKHGRHITHDTVVKLETNSERNNFVCIYKEIAFV